MKGSAMLASTPRRVFASLGVAAGLIASSCWAQEADEMKPIRAALPDKQQGCFVRSYSRDHLAANPQQSVSRIRLARLKAERRREDIDGPEAPLIALNLLLETRTGGKAAEPLDCQIRFPEKPGDAPSALLCLSACNRGRVELIPLGPDFLRIAIGGQVSGRFVPDAVGVGRSCTSDAGVVWLGDKPGERIFELERAELSACR